MLDQNTDRMWYVIGAVIVGAALIFLMNGTFPTLFANVGETFEDKVEQSTEMTDGIRPITRGDNVLDGAEDGVGRTFTTVAWQGWDYVQYELPFELYEIAPGDTFTFSFYVKETNVDVAAFLQARDGTDVKFIQSDKGTVIKKGESGVTSITWTVPEKTNSAIKVEDRAPADTVVLYAALRDVKNDNSYSYVSTVTYNDATLLKQE